MIVVFTLCLLIAVIAVTDISASYLRRQAATSLADGAALAATAAAGAVDIYHGQDPGFVILDQGSAAAAVDTYLTQTGAYTDYPGLDVDVQIDGHTVRVFLSMPYRLPVSMPGAHDTTTIHATGSAQLPVY